MLQGELEGTDADFKQRIKSIISEFVGNDEPIVAYNPGSGTHVSMVEALPQGSRAIFLDHDGEVAHKFVQRNNDGSGREPYEFYLTEMNNFELPEGIMADMVLIYNAGHLDQESLDKVTKVGGVVIVNEWHGVASYMKDSCPNYEPLSVVEAEDETLDLHVFRRVE